MLSIAPVAPGIAAPSRNHWYARGLEPLAMTPKVTMSPSQTVWLIGLALIEGGSRTVTTTAALESSPQRLLAVST